MPARLRNVLKYLFFLGIGGGFLFLTFRQTDWQKLGADFAQADYRYVLLSMAMGYAAFVSRGLRWNLLLHPLGRKAKAWNAINAITLGYFANTAIPRAGEVMRCTALKSTDDLPLERLFGTVVLERVIDGLILMSLIGTTFLLQFDHFAAFIDAGLSQSPESAASSAWLKWLLLGIFVAFLLLLYLLRHRLQSLPAFAKIRGLWQGFKEGFKSLSKVEKKAAFFAHTAFIWIMYFAMIYVVIYALPATENLSLADGLFIMIAGGMGMVVPSPGGIGSYHYLVMLALGILGVDRADGLSFATLVHGGQFIMTVGTGLIALIAVYYQREKRKKSLA